MRRKITPLTAKTIIMPKPICRVKDAAGHETYRDDLVVLSITRLPGPDGGSCTVRYPAAFALASDVELIAEEFQNSILTVDFYPQDKLPTTGDRISQLDRLKPIATVFRGRLSQIGWQVSATENGVDLTFRDDWFSLTDTCVMARTQGLPEWNVGGTLNYLNQDKYRYIYSEEFGDSTIHVRQDLQPFNPSVWPLQDSARWIYLDPELFGIDKGIQEIQWPGESLAKVICDLIRTDPTRLPDLVYDDHLTTVTGRITGHSPRDIKMGVVGKAKVKTDLPEVLSIRGNIDYSTVRNQGIAVGDNGRFGDCFALDKTWSAADEAAVLADLSLLDYPTYRHVGRLWKIPVQVLPTNPIALNERGQEADIGRMNDAPVVWELNGITETVDIKWICSNNRFRIVSMRNIADGLSLDHKYTGNPRNAAAQYVWFEGGAQIYQDAITGNNAFKRLEIQAVQIGNKTTATKTVESPAITRNRFAYIKADDIKTEYYGSVYSMDGTTGERSEVSKSDNDGYDKLIVRVDEFLSDTSTPETNLTITIPWYDFALTIGQLIARIVDSDNRVLRDDLNMIVNGITLDCQAGNTLVECSRWTAAMKGMKLIQ